MFAEGTDQSEAKAVCAPCPVRIECLAYALDNREEYGVWGAMTGRERRALLRRRPEVTSWVALFRQAGGLGRPTPIRLPVIGGTPGE